MFKASNSWYFKLKHMFDLSSKSIIGDAQSADYKSSNDFQRLFHDIVKYFEIWNIFNLDETRTLLETVAGQINHSARKRYFWIKESQGTINNNVWSEYYWREIKITDHR